MYVYDVVKSCLPEYANIKLDRGEGLYIVRLEAVDVQKAVKNLSNNGFLATVSAEFLTVTPKRVIIEEQALRFSGDAPDDHLLQSLKRLRGRGVCEGEIKLFILALKSRLYGEATAEHRLRRQAAICMRAGCGGLLSAVRYATIKDKEANI